MENQITEKTYTDVRRCDHCGEITVVHYYNNDFELLHTYNQVYHYGIGRICSACIQTTKID